MAEKNVFGLGPLDTLLAEYQQGLADAPGLGAPQTPEQSTPKIDTRQPTQAPSRARGLLPPPDMVPLFEATSRKYDVPVNVLMALAQQESSYNPGVRGVATQYGRALGLMQYLPSTAKMMGINPFDAEQSIDAAARQLKERLDKGYSMEDAVREHFAGPDRRGWGPKTAQYGIDVLNKARQIGAQMYGEEPQAMPNLRRNPFLTEGNMSTRQDGPMSVPAGTDRRDLSMPNLPEAPDDSSLASDLGRQALGGTYKGIGETIRGLGALPQIIGEYTTTPLINAIFGTDYRTSNLLDKPADVIKGYGERLQEGVSEATKEAIKASSPDGDILKPSTWTFGENPSIVGYTALGLDVLGQMFPILASAIATGGQSAAVRYGATGLLGGAQGGGAAISEAEDIIDQMAGKAGESGKSVLEEQSAFYRELKSRGLSDNEALQRTKDAASRVAFILTAPVSGIGGIATARIINPAERILSSRTIAERTLGRAALGGAEEGTQEVTESVQTRRGVNVGAGADVDVTEGSFADFVLGAMGGSVPGAVGGALSSREPAGTTDTDRNVTVRTPPPASGPVSRAMQAGMDDAAARRVVVTAPDGSTVSGFLDAYDDDGQGGFVARVLTDDGLPLTVTSSDGVTITPERAAPPALPAPTITVDPAGTATTTEQRQRQTERRQQEDEARRQRRTELGITPDVDRVAQAHRARERLPESLDAGQPISVVTRDGEVIDGTVDAYERTQDGARLTFTDEAGQERSLTQDQFSEINEREASDAKPVDSEQVSDGSASSPTPAGTQRGSKPRKSKADAPRAATSGTSAAEAGGSGEESVAGATGTGDAEPALTPTNRLADMSLDELVEHRKYLSTQARISGWNKLLTREKNRVEAAIRKIDPAALDQFKTPMERAQPDVAARDTDITTPQGKPLVELFHPASGTNILVRKDHWEDGASRLVVFTRGGVRKTGPNQEVNRAALSAPVETKAPAPSVPPVVADGIVEPDVPESAYVDADSGAVSQQDPVIQAAIEAVEAIQALNPQLKNKLRVETLDSDEMANRPTNSLTGKGSRAGSVGAVINLLKEGATWEDVKEEVRHLIDKLLGGSQVAKWIDEDADMQKRVRDFLNSRPDLAPNTRYDDGAEMAQSLLDQYFRNPDAVQEALPDMFTYLEQMGAAKYRPVMKALEDAEIAQDGVAQAVEKQPEATDAAQEAKQPKRITKEEADHLFGVNERREKALQRIAAGRAWFGDEAKARAFIEKNGLTDTHTVEQTGAKRFEVKEKPAGEQTIAEGMRVAVVSKRNGNVVDRGIYRGDDPRTGSAKIEIAPGSISMRHRDNYEIHPVQQAATGDDAGARVATTRPEPADDQTTNVVTVNEDLLRIAEEETRAISGRIMSDMANDQQGVIPGRPTNINRSLKRGNYTLDDIAALWPRTRDHLRARYGDTVTLYRADAPQSQWNADTQVVYMGDEPMARRFQESDRKVQAFEIPVDDVLGLNAQRSGYYEFIVKRPGAPMLAPADQMAVKEESPAAPTRKPKQEAMPRQDFESVAGVGKISAVKERYSDKYGVSWSSTDIASADTMEEAARIAKAVADSGADNIVDMRAAARDAQQPVEAAPAPDAGSVWNSTPPAERERILAQPGGWGTAPGAKNALNPTGRRIAQQTWSEMQPGTRDTVRRLIDRHTDASNDQADSTEARRERAFTAVFDALVDNHGWQRDGNALEKTFENMVVAGDSGITDRTITISRQRSIAEAHLGFDRIALELVPEFAQDSHYTSVADRLNGKVESFVREQRAEARRPAPDDAGDTAQQVQDFIDGKRDATPEPNLEAARKLLQEQKDATGNKKAEANVKRKIRALAKKTPISDERTVMTLDMAATRLNMDDLEFAEAAPSAARSGEESAPSLGGTRQMGPNGYTFLADDQATKIQRAFKAMEVESLSIGKTGDGYLNFGEQYPDGRYRIESADKIVGFDGKGGWETVGEKAKQSGAYDINAEPAAEVARVLSELGAKKKAVSVTRSPGVTAIVIDPSSTSAPRVSLGNIATGTVLEAEDGTIYRIEGIDTKANRIRTTRNPNQTSERTALIDQGTFNRLVRETEAVRQRAIAAAPAVPSPDPVAPAEQEVAPEAKPADDRFAGNKIFTADKVAAARARLRSKLNQLNSGIDPEVMLDGLVISGAYIESGVRNFTQYAKTMIEDLGEGIRPYLLSFWEGARNYPGLDTSDMTGVDESRRQFEALIGTETPQSEAVGEIVKKPARRKKKTGAKQDMTLTQDWGVDHIDGYSDDTDRETGNTVKDAFMKEARSYLNIVAGILTENGYTPHTDAKGRPEKPVRVNESGVAGSGDITLTLAGPDGVGVYVHVGDTALRGVVPTTQSGVAIMFRAAQNGDKYGVKGANQWAPVDLSAADFAALVDAHVKREAKSNERPAEPTIPAADRTGAPQAAARRKRAAQQDTPQLDFGDLEAEQPQNVGTPAAPETDGQVGLRPATENVGTSGGTDAGRASSNRRPRAGGARNADAGTGSAGSAESRRSADRVSATKSPETVSPANEGPGDFIIDDPLRIVGGGQVARFNKNRAAITLRNQLIDEGRKPTREEQEVLAGYTGWGSFGQELFQGTWNDPKPKQGWEERDQWLRDNLGQKEWEGLQKSIINAHYTDPPTVLAMWDMVKRAGFDGGRVLEPSIGIGNFFGMMPPELAGRSQRAGIELDPVTGSMAQMLYPKANIQIKGYEESKTPDNFYDLVIGNWPFADFSPADRRYDRINPMLHDYFFLKALDQTRPGGLVVGITSSGTMDKKSSKIRTEIAKRGELVAAFRLPTGAFEEYAGTKVVTDILVLRKRAEPAGVVAGEGWINVKPFKTREGTEIQVNEYYIANPDHVIGEIDFGHGTTTGRPGMIVHRPDNMMEQLRRIVDLVPEGAYRPDTRGEQISYITNHLNDRTNSLVKTDDGLFVVRGEFLAPANEVQKYRLKSEAATAEREAQLSKLIDMRRMYGELIEAERAGDATTQRKALREAYEAFKKEHKGYSESFGLKYLRQIDDPFYPALAALEVPRTDAKGKVKYEPALILSESTIRGAKKLENPTISDAFVLARNESVNPSPERIAEIAGRPVEEVRRELVESGAAFETPGGDFVPADMYLSGNVREKLRQAKAGLEAGNAAMQRNIDALSAVVPADIPYYKIETQFGATWVPSSVYEQYVAHMLGLPDAGGISVKFHAGAWKIDFPSQYNHRAEAKTGFGTPEVPFKRLVRAAIANQTINVKRKDSDGNEYVDHEATKEANARIADIRLKFSEWLWSEPERRVDLEQEYNETRNAYATAKFDGSFLNFPGMALSLGRGPFDLRQHQINAIWRALVMKRSLNAHEVGTGKTFTMGGIAVESRRYGIAKKPMLFAHNANSKTVAAEIQQMYPAAKVLYVDNLSKDNIKTRMMQIANDDWDVVVLPHSLIDRIGFKEETLMEMAQQELADLEEAAREAAAEDGAEITDEMLEDEEALKKLRSPTAKQLVKQRFRILNTIKKLSNQASRDDSIAFEDLGVDMILVDEAHEFKKPPIATKMKMKGLQTQTSNRSIAMSFITRYVRGMNSGGNVHLFTGTPITNTMTEVFHMMRYMMQEEMEQHGLADWDGWFGSFAREVEDVELSSTGEYETVTRLQAFINVPELRRMIGQYMDVVFADDMPEMQPRRVNGKTLSDPTLTEEERAELLNGRTENAADRPYKKVVNESADMSPEQLRVFERVQSLATQWRNMTKKQRKDAMAAGDETVPIIYDGIAERASFDVRLVDAIENAGKEGTPEMEPHPDSKPARVVKNLIEIYRSHPNANQVVFMEQGISNSVTRSEGEPGNKRQVRYKAFSTLNDMVERLVQAGVPREQIAVVTGATNKSKRKEIADAMNRGDVRIVFGSTDSLGVGVNMQKNLRAMHHMDAPWMPGELEQRNGRGHRQGNQWNTVMEYRYLTDRLDGRRWQVLAIKQRFITDFMKSKGEARVIEGDAAADEQGDILSTFADAAGDPRILVREKLKKKLEGLQSRERLHGHAQADAARQVRRLTDSIADQRGKLKAFVENKVADKAAALTDAQRGDGFRATIFGQSFTSSTEARDFVRDMLPSELRIGQSKVIGTYGDYELRGEWDKFSNSPHLTLEIGGQVIESHGPSLPSLAVAIRDLRDMQSRIEKRIQNEEATLERMRAVSQEPFHLAGQLEAVEKQLADLERDIAENPVAPPHWLRSGAPTETAVFWNGKEFTVTGHRWNDSGWYVLAEDESGSVAIPYMEAMDNQGMPLYEEHEFSPPTVIDRNAEQAQAEPPSDISLSVAEKKDKNAQRLDQLESRARALSTEVDAAYKAEDFPRAEELDAQLESVYEELEAALSEQQEDGVDVESPGFRTGQVADDTDMEVGLEEVLARDYYDLFVNPNHYRSDESRASKAATLRAQFTLFRGADAAQKATDKQVIEAAKDAYENRRRLAGRGIRYSVAAEGGALGLSARGTEAMRAQQPIQIRSTAAERDMPTGQLRTQAFAALRDEQGLNNPDIGQIAINRSGWGKSRANSADRAKLLSLPALPEIIREGAYLGSQPAGKGRGVAFHYIGQRVNIDGVPLAALVTVEEHRDGSLTYYNHTMLSDPFASGRGTGSVGSRLASYHRPIFTPDRQRTRKEASFVSHARGHQALLDGPLGGLIDTLIGQGHIVLHPDENALPTSIRLKGGSAVQGWTDRNTGIIHLVAENLTPQTAQPVLLHEALHSGGERLIGTPKWNNLLRRADAMRRAAELRRADGRVQEGNFWDGALRRLDAARAAGAVSEKRLNEEFAAYAIEEYELAPSGVKKWVDALIGAVKDWLFRRFGIQAGQVTPAQLRAMALAALRSVQGTSPLATQQVNGAAFGSMAMSTQAATDTPAFRKWFGDSKVVDAEGNPLVVYHGTAADFDQFDPARLGDNTRAEAGELGFFFTSKTFLSDSYAEIASRGGWGGKTQGGDAVVYPVYLSLQNPKRYETASEFYRDADAYKGRLSEWRTALEAQGFDGVVVRDDFEEVIAFRPEQIKSATGNRGTFDASNPNIMFSVTPDLKEATDALDTDTDYLDFGGLPDVSGAAIRDMTSRYMKYVAHPRHIAALHDEFVPVFKAANDQQHDRNATLEELHADYKAYDTLKTASKDRVNRILELGRLVGEVYTDAQLSGGVTNPGFARTVVRDESGEPHIVRQPLNAALSKEGDVIRLNAREIEAYRGLRRMFDKALDMFRDQALVEFGFGEYAGMDKPLDALRKLVDGKPKTDQKANRIRNVIQFIEDIEQSKRAGYVPFSRYGDYVIAVKERIAALKYRKFGDGYLVRGVTPELDNTLERMGAIYDAEEHEWYVTEEQRIELERANERTVYSEKIETGLRDKFGKNSEGKVKRRRAKVENIPSVKAARARIEKEYLDGHSDRRVIAFETTKKRGEGGIDLTALDALAELAQIDNPTWDAVRGELQKALQAGGFRRHFFQSSHVPGYTTDFQRSIADYMVGMSGYLARRRFNDAWDKALADIKGAALHEYAAKYRTYFNDPREEFAALRQAAFVMKIGANVSSALVNLTQTFLTTIPTLNQIAGHARVATELTKAAKDALAMVTPKAGTNVFDMSKAPADLREEFAKADAAGLFLPLNSFDLMGQANQRTAAARRTQDVANTATSVISLPFSASERFNRIVAFTAAARLAKRKGLAGKIRNHFKNDAWARESFGRDFTPYDFAEWLAQETQFQMGKINRPTMMRGAGAAMLQFRSFMMQLLEKMYRDWTLHGAAGKVSTISTLAMMIAFSGLWGAPGSDDLRKLLEFLYKQASGKDVDLKDAMRQTIYGATGSMLVTDALSSGIPYYFGLDLSQRIGLGNILPEQYNKTGLDTLDMMTMVGGPGFDILVAAPIRAIGMVSAGNIAGAAGELAPVWAKNPMQAYQWQTDAVRTKRGDKVLDRSEIDGVDIALKAIGVQPSRVSRQYEMSSAQFRAQRGSDDAKRALRLDLVRAMERERNNTDQHRAAALRADVDAAIEKIREWNRSAPPDQRISLKPSNVRAMMQRERLGGQSVVQRAPRASRESALRRAEAYGIGLGR